MKHAYSAVSRALWPSARVGSLGTSMKTPPPMLRDDAFAALFDAQPTPGLVMDQALYICFANRAALAMLGYERSELP